MGFGKTLWDITCAASIVGIWPRFIEPNLLAVTKIDIPVKKLPKALEGFRIIQFSDLHLGASMPDSFLNRVAETVRSLAPDLIVFTGDFVCYSQFTDASRLIAYLSSFSAPYGCFAILGNHDYNRYVGVNEKGEYDIIDSSSSEAGRALRRLLKPQPLLGRASARLQKVHLESELKSILAETPFVLLDNETRQIAVGDTQLNITGLGEYMASRFDPQRAFAQFDPRYPGIILLHNPDAAPRLAKFPGDLIVAGHVHGGQINLPWVRDRFAVVEYPTYRRGLFKLDDRYLYVNRGLGGTIRFRWRARPEITQFTLQGAVH